MKWIRSFPATFVTILIAALIFAGAQIFELDIFEQVLGFLAFMENYELDELIIPGLFVLIGLLVDLRVSSKRESRGVGLQKQKLRAVKASVRDARNDLDQVFANLEEFRSTVTSSLNSESLATFDRLIQDGSESMKRLRKAQDITQDEKSVGA